MVGSCSLAFALAYLLTFALCKLPLILKKGHAYYYQVQGQLKICRRQWCYFITYTHCDIKYEKIAADNAFFEEKMFPALSTFWETHYLPYIVKNLVKDPAL